MAKSKRSSSRSPKGADDRPLNTAEGAASSAATLGFEQTLWQAADKLRNNMDAAEYKHVVLGLIFLKYISDAFEEDGEPFEEELARLVAVLEGQFEEGKRLEKAIRGNLRGLGYGDLPKITRVSPAAMLP